MSRPRLIIAAVAVVALVGLAVGASLDPAGAARAWLVGFVVAGLAPLGALVLVMIGRLTRGGWAETLEPSLRALGGVTPWLWLLGAPIALALPWIYPWASGSGPPAYLKLYLSPLAFLARSVAALGGWTVLALMLRSNRLGKGLSAAGLVFQGLVLSIVPNDWLLSLQPGWTTTDFGMTILTLEVLAVASVMLLLTPPGKAADDMAGFLIAGVLGAAYLVFVAYLIDWYGDLPNKTGWWIERFAQGRWPVVIAALAAGAASLACLAFGRRYKAAALCALLGAALYGVWLVLPLMGPYGWLSAPCAIALNAAVLAFAVLASPMPVQRATREAAHA